MMAEKREPISRPAPDPDTRPRTVSVPTEVDWLGRAGEHAEVPTEHADMWDVRRWQSSPNPAGPRMIRPWRFHP